MSNYGIGRGVDYTLGNINLQSTGTLNAEEKAEMCIMLFGTKNDQQSRPWTDQKTEGWLLQNCF
jgi:hypothetical protein